MNNSRERSGTELVLVIGWITELVGVIFLLICTKTNHDLFFMTRFIRQ